MPRVEAAVTFLAPVRAETEQPEHSLKRARESRAPYILATTGRALMLRFAHRTVAHMRPAYYQSLPSSVRGRYQHPKQRPSEKTAGLRKCMSVCERKKTKAKHS